jgi:hypothetical protein
MEGAVTVVAGDTGEVEIPEDYPGVVLPVGFPEVIEELASLHHPSVPGVTVGEQIEVLTARDLITARDITEAMSEAEIEVVTPRDITEAMSGDIIMAPTTIPEDIMEAITGTTTEDMPPMERPSGFFLVGQLLEVCIVNPGGPITPCRYLQPIMTRTTNFPILLLPM